jgi:SpoVK/Ycf46/Vps4 family AAA+-type ATPase
MPLQTTETVRQDLQSRLQAGYPLLFLRTWEEARWEQELADLAAEMEYGLVTWSVTTGFRPSLATDGDDPGETSPAVALSLLDQFPEQHLFLMKDFHPYLSDPAAVRQLRELAAVLPQRRQSILLIDPQGRLPMELEKEALLISLPLPDYRDFRAALDQLLIEPALSSDDRQLSEEDEDRLIKAVLGLTLEEAVRAWRRALLGQSSLTDEALTKIIAEKRHLASASELLEFHDLDAGADDVGGLDVLKTWLKQRAEAYSPRAREQGIPLPKGALLLGVQGCGKSLTARAAARMLAFPLVRLDVASLLSSARGETERNLREVFRLVESIAPVVMWMDEMEKGFAGLEGSVAGDATMNRVVGSFLLWMQELTKPVFIVATANSVQQLPPELLRRGRFDELFFIDLPNFQERRQILSVHLKKRGWKPEQFAVETLAEKTDGYSGAELEQVVSAALIDAFGRHAVLADADLERARRQLVPLSVSMADKIFALRQWAQDRCRRATSDNRVAQMLDAEQRSGAFDDEDEVATVPAWVSLVQAGQFKAALVEYVRSQGEVTFPELLAAFEPYTTLRGELGLAVRGNPNCVLWLGMSNELCEVLVELISSKRLYVHPADRGRYLRLGQKLALPELPEPTDEKLTKPRWLPASLRIGPHSEHGARLARIGRIQLGAGASG